MVSPASALRPPAPYPGGKQRVAEKIVSLFPDHTHYVEPYCGSLAVLLGKPRSRMETVNDLDSELMTFWRVVRDRGPELQHAVAMTPHSRAEHAAAYGPATDELEVARRVYVRLTQGVTGRLTPTSWRWHRKPPGGSTMAGYHQWYAERLAPAADRLADVFLENLPALDLIGKYGSEPSVLLYVDPPYPAQVRNSANYRHEMPRPEQHRDLAAALRACRASVVLSGYACDLYDRDLFSDWHRVEIAAYTAQGGQGKDTTEVLWSNRPFPLLDGGLFALEVS